MEEEDATSPQRPQEAQEPFLLPFRLAAALASATGSGGFNLILSWAYQEWVRTSKPRPWLARPP